MPPPKDDDRRDLGKEIGSSLTDAAKNASKIGISFDRLNEALRKTAPSLKALAGEIKPIEAAIDHLKDLPKIFELTGQQMESFDLPKTFHSMRTELEMITPSLGDLTAAEGAQVRMVDDMLPRLKDWHVKHQDLGKDFIKMAKDGKIWNQQLTDLTLGLKKQTFWEMVKKGMKNAFTVDKDKKAFFDRVKSFRDDLKAVTKGDAVTRIDKFKEMSTSSKAQVAAAGAAAVSFGMMGDALQGLKKVLFATWDFIDTKVLPTTANLNRALGNSGKQMGALRSQAIGTGDTMEELGLSFEQGANAVMGLATSLNTVRLPKETLSVGLKLSEYVGLGAEQAGKLISAFTKTGSSVAVLDAGLRGAAQQANLLGVPINAIRKDIGDNIDIVQRFGTANIDQFSKSAAKARSYGLDIKQVTAAVGKAMDTFAGTSEVAAKLNTVFGTNINSLELMMETDPTKRMEMLRGELDRQGKSWDKLNTFEKNVVTTTLGVNEEAAALGLSSGKARDSIMAQAKAQARLVDQNKEWDKGLGNLRSTLVNSRKEFELMFRAISEVVAKFLGFNNATQGAYTVADTFKNIMHQVTGQIKDFADHMEPNKNGFTNAKSVLDEIRTAFENIASAAETLDNTLDNLQWIDKSHADTMVKTFQRLKNSAGNNDPVDAMQMSTLTNSFDNSNDDSQKMFYKQLKKAHISQDEADSVLGKMRLQGNVPSKSNPNAASAPDYLVPVNVNLVIDGKQLASIMSKHQVQVAAK